MGVLGGGLAHGFGRVERERKGRIDGLRRGEAGELVDGAAAGFGLEIPEGAVERVAGGAGGEEVL